MGSHQQIKSPKVRTLSQPYVFQGRNKLVGTHSSLYQIGCLGHETARYAVLTTVEKCPQTYTGMRDTWTIFRFAIQGLIPQEYKLGGLNCYNIGLAEFKGGLISLWSLCSQLQNNLHACCLLLGCNMTSPQIMPNSCQST